MKKIPLIGIMVPARQGREKILQNYTRFAGSLEIQLFSFVPNDMEWKKRRGRGVYMKDGMSNVQWFRLPDAVYNRCYFKGAIKIKRLSKYIGKQICFNKITYLNKWKVNLLCS